MHSPVHEAEPKSHPGGSSSRTVTRRPETKTIKSDINSKDSNLMANIAPRPTAAAMIAKMKERDDHTAWAQSKIIAHKTSDPLG